MFLKRGLSFEAFRDSEEVNQIRLFSRLFAFVFIALTLNLPLIWPILVASPTRMMITGAALTMTALAWIAVNRGWLEITRVLIAIGYWGLVMLLVFNTGGLQSPWLMAQLVIVVLVGLLVGGNFAFVLAFLSIAFDIVLFVFDDAVAAVSESQGLPIEYLSVTLINLLVIGAVIYFTNRMAKTVSDIASENELRYRSLFDKTNDAVFLIGLDNRQIKTNERAARMLGYEPEELIGMHIDQVVAPEEREEAYAVVGRLQEQDMLPVYERTMVRKDGSRLTVDINVAMITDQKGQPLYIQSVVRDVSERKRFEQQLRDNLAEMEDIAMQDALTGLLNRRAITEHVDVEWHRSQREKQPMCVLLIDMDNLKDINDKHGHKMGDAALLQLTSALRASKRRYDWMGRWGGDEFLMVLPNTNLTQAKEVAERCRSVIETELLTDPKGGPIKVEASIGLACYSGRDGEEIAMDVLLAQADQALYKAKGDGRNKVAIYRD